MVLETECPFVGGGGEGDISLRNASFPQLFRATVRNNQIDILLHEINRKTAALAGFEGRSYALSRLKDEERKRQDWDETLFIAIRIAQLSKVRRWSKISLGEVEQFQSRISSFIMYETYEISVSFKSFLLVSLNTI